MTIAIAIFAALFLIAVVALLLSIDYRLRVLDGDHRLLRGEVKKADRLRRKQVLSLSSGVESRAHRGAVAELELRLTKLEKERHDLITREGAEALVERVNVLTKDVAEMSKKVSALSQGSALRTLLPPGTK